MQVELLASVGTAIRTLQGAVDLTGKLSQANEKLKDVEFAELIADLKLQLADTKIATAEIKVQMAALIEENLKLKEENSFLKNSKDEEPLKVGEGGHYYKPDGDGPFCTVCKDSRGELIRLVQRSEMFAPIYGLHKCAICLPGKDD